MTYRRFPIPPTACDAWPAADLHDWEQARRPGDVVDEGGPASHWSGRTAAQMRVNYGCWLGWLAARGHLVPDEKPQARATPERIGAYIAELTTVMAPRSVERRITFLVQTLRVMVPGMDLAGLRRRAATLNATAVPVRDKRARLVPVPVLIDAGIGLIAAAERGTFSDLERAAHFRDGLMIAFLALRPVRLGNLAGMRLGQQVLIDRGAVSVAFSAGEVKNRQPLEFPWPAPLLEPLQTYLERYRPRLLDGQSHAALWVSHRGATFTPKQCQYWLGKRTRSTLGQPVGPHLFRDCAATTIALLAPKEARIISSILGHEDPQVAARHYNHAGALVAAQAHQARVLALRAGGNSDRAASMEKV